MMPFVRISEKLTIFVNRSMGSAAAEKEFRQWNGLRPARKNRSRPGTRDEKSGRKHTKNGMIFVRTKRNNAKTLCVMKKRGYMIGAMALALMAAGCSSTYFASAGYGDDLYAVHDKAAIARRQQAEAEAKKAEAEARKAEWEARLAEAEANAVQRRYYDAAGTSNPYDEVLADTYESAYARRLRGFESPTYRLPSSYYDFRYGTSFSYVSAYDPAFYNVMVMGDQVWVEPKYITAMFGSWGRPSIYADPWYYGWNTYRPYYGWGLSFGGWGWGFGCYDPWYGPGWGWGYPGWNWGWPGYPGHPHWGGGHGHAPHRPYASNIVHRADPNASPSGRRYYRSNLRFDAPVSGGGTSYRSSNRTGDFGVRNSSGTNRNNGSSTTPSRNNNRNNTSGSYNRNNRGGNTYDRGNSNNNGTYNRGSNSNWSNSSNSSGSYNRGSSSGGSYNRGSSGGGSSRNAGGR